MQEEFRTPATSYDAKLDRLHMKCVVGSNYCAGTRHTLICYMAHLLLPKDEVFSGLT